MANKVSLMDSILLYAMEGKLVPQVSSDSDAQDFLSCLFKKKGKVFNKIILEGGKYYEVIKGLKKDVSNELSVQIPSSWTYVRLKDLADKIEAGGTPSRSISAYWDNGTIPWVKIGDMQSKYVRKTGEFITKEGLDNSTAKLLPKGTILYSIFASIGTTAFLDIEACTNQAITGLFFDESLNKDFIYYFLRNSATYMLKQSHGTAQNNINQTILKNMFIPFPPIEEQERIVNKIKQIEILVESYEKLKKDRSNLDFNIARKMRLSIIKTAIKGELTKRLEVFTPVDETLEKMKAERKNKIVISSEKPPFDIPSTWRWVCLSNIVKSINAGGDKPDKFSKVKTSELTVPVYSNGEINDGLFGFTDKAVVFEKALTISGRGTIGFSKVRNEPFVPIVRLLVLRALDETNLDYISYAVEGLMEYGSGSAVKQLTVPMIADKLIPFPPLEEQKLIVKVIEDTLEKVKDLMIG